ncbi:helix-turn-helix domain-containing protein [Salinimicrobium marinum]|nr:AraC family transcriptional regulator [Salinimicrobium marinum]
MKIHVKNMVCDRCIIAVTEIMDRLGISYKTITLGEVALENSMSKTALEELKLEFLKIGFEVIDDKYDKLINKMKSLIIKEVYETDITPDKRLSEILAGSLMYDYSFLSSLFKKSEGMSIEKFRSDLKLERAKELLEYGELNINEIAAEIGYKSVSYFCSKFKKETGYTPLAYQKKHIRSRVGINTL